MMNKNSKTRNYFKLVSLKRIGAIFIFSLVITVFSPDFIFAQSHCGKAGQRPCRVWERIPSCNKGLREDFRADRCVSAGKTARKSFLKICNNDSDKTISFVAVIWDLQSKQWMGQGWYRIDETECTVVEVPGNFQGYVHVYAEMEGKTWVGEDGNFCVPTDINGSFRLPDRRNCRAPNYKRVDLFGIWFNPGTTQTFYLKTTFGN